MAGSKENKERVIHTRVPEALEREIKALADSLRVPVSSLVRNILEDAVTALESAAQNLKARAGRIAQREFADVIGWQPLALNVTAACAKCANPIRAGETGHLAVRDQAGPRMIICSRCVPQPGEEA